MNALNPRRMRMAGMALLVVTFAVGMLAGTAFGRVLTAREPGAPTAEECERKRGPHHIFDELDLSPAQKAQIDAIMARRRAVTDSLWQSDGARIRAAVDSTRAEIRAVLTPAQAAEYDRRRQEIHDEKRRKREAEAHRGRQPGDSVGR
ncbi:MAG TPA: Spy/CpxP family protein refolding chaperone [Longimicrobium sp.]|nr:Spy/CpxP family protein refolding chaperone [Longimicrobium sp.]